MDIKHFSYFTTIVECGYNLSSAAKKIHITQSALSKIITTFEQEEGVRLFFRVNGRLNGLTSAGELFYNACVDISTRYDEMMEQVRQVSENDKSKVVVGIPPLILTLFFTNILSDFRKSNAGIPVTLVEAGAEELTQRFMNQELDFAVVLAPTSIRSPKTQEHLIHTAELTAFMAADHELAKKPYLNWSDLDSHPLSIFNETFSINRYISEKMKKENITPIIALKSGSWDFLIESVANSNLITILPAPIKSFIHTPNLVEIPFRDPIAWRVVLAEHTDKKLTLSQQRFKDYVLAFANK